MDLFSDVVEFHEKFNLPPVGLCTLLPPDLYKFRYKFLTEELGEFVVAHHDQDKAKALDALVDLVYVALGTAHLMGMPFNEAWQRVHEANMKKVRAERPDQSTRNSAFDVIKPPGWTPPDIQEIIDQYTTKATK